MAGAFFPFGVFEDAHMVSGDPAAFRAMARDLFDHGLNSVCFVNNQLARDGVLLDVADETGLRVVYAPNGDLVDFYERAHPTYTEAVSLLAPVGKALWSHHSVIGANLKDDATTVLIPHLTAVMAALRGEAPVVPAFPTIPGGSQEVFQRLSPPLLLTYTYPCTIDTGICDFYTPDYLGKNSIGQGCNDAAGFWRVMSWGRAPGTPLWTVLQTHGSDNLTLSHLRTPTVEEVRLQTWLALAEGSKGVFYFVYSTQQFWIGLKDNPELYGEVASLAQRTRPFHELLLRLRRLSHDWIGAEITNSGETQPHLSLPFQPQAMCHEDERGQAYAFLINRSPLSQWLRFRGLPAGVVLEEVERGFRYGPAEPIPFAGGDGRLFRVSGMTWPAAPAGRNLLSNPGFEAEGAAADVWKLSTGAQIAVREQHRGARSLQLTGDGTQYYVHQALPSLRPNTPHIIQFWAKTSRLTKGRVWLRYVMTKPYGVISPAVTPVRAGFPEWQRYSQLIYSPPDAGADQRLDIVYELSQGEAVWIDDAVLAEGATPPQGDGVVTETAVVILDDFSDGGAKWQVPASAGGVPTLLERSTARAGTALGNAGGAVTLRYAFSQANGDMSARLALPAPVDVSQCGFLCCDVFVEPGGAEQMTRLGMQVVTARGTADLEASHVYDGNWAYMRLDLNRASGIDRTGVQAINVVVEVRPGATVTLEIDTVRACTYEHDASDFFYYGRNAGAPTPATIKEQARVVQRYLFGSTDGIGPAAASGGYELDPAKPNFGAVIGWNQWTGQPEEVALDNESDHTFNTGLLLVGLVQLYRMSAEPVWLDCARWLVEHYFLSWYVSAATQGAAPGSVGFMPYAVRRTGIRLSQTSTDQYLGMTWGLLEYHLVTHGADARVPQMLTDFQTWWNSAQHVAYDGTPHANLGNKSPLTDAAVAFVRTGDSTAADPGLASQLASGTYDPARYPYRRGWLGTENSYFNQYSTLTFAIDLLRCRLRRTKAPYPGAAVAQILRENALFAFGFGQYYTTDLGPLGTPFGTRPLGWTPIEGTPWDGIKKVLRATSTGSVDALDMVGTQWLTYVGPVLLQFGGDVQKLMAAGRVVTPPQSVRSLMGEILALASKNGISAPGSPADGAIPRAALGPWQIYHNQINGSPRVGLH
ncbi:MAG: hypothetical protein M1118_10950, partial [Chloroflexi bacterium]|nr:hypothetical protein [Chloroflexota bacterium]